VQNSILRFDFLYCGTGPSVIWEFLWEIKSLKLRWNKWTKSDKVTLCRCLCFYKVWARFEYFYSSSNILSGQYIFYFGRVTGKVKSGERDFQDGATGRKRIAFRNILWQKKARKGEGIKVFTLFPPVPPCSRPAPGEKTKSNIFFQKCSISG